MSAIQTLLAISKGIRPSGNIVSSCRLEISGAEYYGEEAIVSAFRHANFKFSQNPDIISSETNIAVFDGEIVLFADIINDNLCRIWCLSTQEPIEAEPAIGVPFDPDMNQARGDVKFSPSDHPELDKNSMPHVEHIGREIARGWTATDKIRDYRTRAFLIRAFNHQTHGAALFAVHRLGDGMQRTTGFAYSVARFQTQKQDLVNHSIFHDQSGIDAIDTKIWRSQFS